MLTIDALGKACPIPVVLAKKEAEKLSSTGGEFTILVDNQPACENLKKMANGNGYSIDVEEIETDKFSVKINVSKQSTTSNPISKPVQEQVHTVSNKGPVVVLSKDSMGQGSEELGKILIKGFIFSLTELERIPKTVLLFNSGVLLATKDSNTLEDLITLEQKGTEICVCGTCANYFSVTESIGVGKIVNMMNIVESMSSAQSIINI